MRGRCLLQIQAGTDFKVGARGDLFFRWHGCPCQDMYARGGPGRAGTNCGGVLRYVCARTRAHTQTPQAPHNLLLGRAWLQVGSVSPNSTGWTAMRGRMGIALQPGTTHVLDRQTRQLVPCTRERCPYAYGTSVVVSAAARTVQQGRLEAGRAGAAGGRREGGAAGGGLARVSSDASGWCCTGPVMSASTSGTRSGLLP